MAHTRSSTRTDFRIRVLMLSSMIGPDLIKYVGGLRLGN